MRIRKGHRCLPLPPADRSSLHGVLSDAKDGSNQALLSLVALASASVADNLIGGSQSVQQEHAKDTSTERKKFLEHELERNRVSADDDFSYSSSFRNAGVNSIVREPSETPLGAKYVFSRHEPLDKTGTTSCSTSAIEIQHQSDLTCHVSSSTGMTGLSVNDTVSPTTERGTSGLNGVGEQFDEKEAKSFLNSSKFVECNERETYFFLHLPAGGSEFHHKKTVSSRDMLGAATQPQSLQKSRSNSLGSTVIEPTETLSVHGGKRKAVQNKRYVQQSKVAIADEDVTTTSHNSSSSASRSHNATQMDPCVTLCARDDGKGWMCPRPAEVGFAMCTYHRDLINQGKERRMRARLEAGPNLPFRYVANARVMNNAIVTENSWSPFSDDEVSYDEYRQVVKAKSITSLLLDVRPRH